MCCDRSVSAGLCVLLLHSFNIADESYSYPMALKVDRCVVSVVPDEIDSHLTALNVDGCVVSVIPDESDSHRTALKVDGYVLSLIHI